eukprot:7447291-Alexandrium_andersonii.AAC.1
MSVAVLFVDVVSAFYSALRPLVLSTHSVEEALTVLQAKGVPEPTVRYIADAMRGTAADLQAAIEPASISLMEAAHTANWLSINGIEEGIGYTQGSIPGDPWADVFFGLIHAR